MTAFGSNDDENAALQVGCSGAGTAKTGKAIRRANCLSQFVRVDGLGVEPETASSNIDISHSTSEVIHFIWCRKVAKTHTIVFCKF